MQNNFFSLKFISANLKQQNSSSDSAKTISALISSINLFFSTQRGLEQFMELTEQPEVNIFHNPNIQASSKLFYFKYLDKLVSFDERFILLDELQRELMYKLIGVNDET